MSMLRTQTACPFRCQIPHSNIFLREHKKALVAAAHTTFVLLIRIVMSFGLLARAGLRAI